MLVERDAIRAIILTPENEVLLLRIHSPDDKERFWWITPGGGREIGETVEDALKRNSRRSWALTNMQSVPWYGDDNIHSIGQANGFASVSDITSFMQIGLSR